MIIGNWLEHRATLLLAQIRMSGLVLVESLLKLPLCQGIGADFDMHLQSLRTIRSATSAVSGCMTPPQLGRDFCCLERASWPLGLADRSQDLNDLPAKQLYTS